MRKLLRSQDILLLGLSHTLDLFEEIKDPLRLMSKSYENMYGWIPRKYKRHHFNHLVWRSIRTGNIEKIEKNGEAYLRLTSQGYKKITRDFPLISIQHKPWDKRWRVAIFDIQEVNKKVRDRLRSKLKELGFGMLQESVFITPHDVGEDLYEYVEHLGLSDMVYILEASQIRVGDKKELANKVWKLDLLNNSYGEIINELINRYLTTSRGREKLLNSKGEEEVKQKYL